MMFAFKQAREFQSFIFPIEQESILENIFFFTLLAGLNHCYVRSIKSFSNILKLNLKKIITKLK